MPVRAGGKVSGVRYAGSKTYIPLVIEGLNTPVLLAVTNNSFTIEYLPGLTGILSMIVTSMAASQPLDGAFDASIETQVTTAYSTVQLVHQGLSDPDKAKVWVQLISGPQRITASLTVEYLLETYNAFFSNNF